jgi:hypothetical protein
MRPPKTSPEAEKLRRDISAMTDRANKRDPWHAYAGLAEASLLLEYYAGDGDLRIRYVSREQKPLHMIQGWTKRVSEQTTVVQAALVSAILTGFRLGESVRLADRTRVRLPGLQLATIERRWRGPMHAEDPAIRMERLVIELDVQDLTDRDLRQIRRDAEESLRDGPRGAPRRRKISDRQHKVLHIVTEMGGPPIRRFDQRFWTLVGKKMKVDDWRAAARLYQRATRHATD